MGFTIKEFIEAIAKKLTCLYPDYDVHPDEIKQNGYEDCFYIGLIEATQMSMQPHRYKRRYDFDIQFFPADDSKESFFCWSEIMMRHFTKLNVAESLYFTRDFETSENDRIFHCLFSIEFFVKEDVKKDYFEHLDWRGEIKHVQG